MSPASSPGESEREESQQDDATAARYIHIVCVLLQHDTTHQRGCVHTWQLARLSNWSPIAQTQQAALCATLVHSEVHYTHYIAHCASVSLYM